MATPLWATTVAQCNVFDGPPIRLKASSRQPHQWFRRLVVVSRIGQHYASLPVPNRVRGNKFYHRLFWSTNSPGHFLLLGTIDVPSLIHFHLLQPPRCRRFHHRNSPIDDRTFLQAAAIDCGPPMDPIMKSGVNKEITLNEEKSESKTTQAAKYKESRSLQR
ncbi:hypothetical protein KFK09_012554 [Dendrobium nobile]|uniref:Uncharacterized protein n=1 Tax=Dendrobium nobile TaxID=94219 RepID=A0A8T3BI23_DENNO|nr:hypothetical protein KFK09_012554 [Dendrobium nobile]